MQRCIFGSHPKVHVLPGRASVAPEDQKTCHAAAMRANHSTPEFAGIADCFWNLRLQLRRLGSPVYQNRIVRMSNAARFVTVRRNITYLVVCVNGSR